MEKETGVKERLEELFKPIWKYVDPILDELQELFKKHGKLLVGGLLVFLLLDRANKKNK